MSKSNQDQDKIIEDLEEAMDNFDPEAAEMSDDSMSSSQFSQQSHSDDQVAELEEKCQDLEEKYKRVIADYRNLEHRVQSERVQLVKTANRWLIESLLEPLDFMEKATAHINDKGLSMVIDRFYQVLGDEGLQEIKALGQPFDERTMEAVETDAGEEGKVVKVLSKGFTLNDQVIRHAKVVVGNGSEGN